MVDSVTQECNDYGLEIQTSMYHEVAREVCNGCGKDITDDRSHLKEEVLKVILNVVLLIQFMLWSSMILEMSFTQLHMS